MPTTPLPAPRAGSRLRRSLAPDVATLLAALAALGVLVPSAAPGAEHFVGDPLSFAAALQTAETNDEDDVIHVAAGTYAVGATLGYTAGEPRALSVLGAGPGATILDGGNSIQILSFQATSGSLHVEGLTLRNGRSTSSGGGALHLESGGGSITVARCVIEDSSVAGTDGIGGGGYLVADGGDVTVDETTFRRNASGTNVGGLYAATTSGTISVTGSLFEDNTVDNGGGQEYFGDAGGAMLYAEAGGRASVSGSTFRGNATTGGDNPDGGGLMIYLLGAGVDAGVAGSVFDDNQAGLGGGGLFVRINDSGTITATGNTFSSNRALEGSGGGGFLYLESGPLTVSDNETLGNSAGEDGGGLWISHGSGSGTLTGNSFAGDEAGGNGGGLSLVTDTAVTSLRRNVLREGLAGGVGGGFSLATGSGTFDLRTTTTWGNTAGDGGGLYVYWDSAAATIAVTDVILWNDAPNALGFSAGAGPADLLVRYSNVEGGLDEPWLGEGSIDTDPLFVDAAAGDLRLAWPSFPDPGSGQSPCIDAGDPASPPDPDGTRSDMGALPFDQAMGLVFADGFESGDTGGWSAVVG